MRATKQTRVSLGFAEITTYEKNGVRTHDVFRFADGLTRINRYMYLDDKARQTNEPAHAHISITEYRNGKRVFAL